MLSQKITNLHNNFPKTKIKGKKIRERERGRQCKYYIIISIKSIYYALEFKNSTFLTIHLTKYINKLFFFFNFILVFLINITNINRIYNDMRMAKI